MFSPTDLFKMIKYLRFVGLLLHELFSSQQLLIFVGNIVTQLLFIFSGARKQYQRSELMHVARNIPNETMRK